MVIIIKLYFLIRSNCMESSAWLGLCGRGREVARITTAALCMGTEGREPLPWDVMEGVLEYMRREEVYCMGGCLRDKLDAETFNVMERYDPDRDQWCTLDPMPTPRSDFGACVVGGWLYCIGGYNVKDTWLRSVERYHPETHTWAPVAPMPTPRCAFGACEVNGELFCVGGDNAKGYLGTLERYTPDTDRWMELAPMPTKRTSPSVSVVDGSM